MRGPQAELSRDLAQPFPASDVPYLWQTFIQPLDRASRLQEVLRFQYNMDTIRPIQNPRKPARQWPGCFGRARRAGESRRQHPARLTGQCDGHGASGYLAPSREVGTSTSPFPFSLLKAAGLSRQLSHFPLCRTEPHGHRGCHSSSGIPRRSPLPTLGLCLRSMLSPPRPQGPHSRSAAKATERRAHRLLPSAPAPASRPRWPTLGVGVHSLAAPAGIPPGR